MLWRRESSTDRNIDTTARAIARPGTLLETMIGYPNEENLENNERMKEEEGYATMKIDEVESSVS